MEGDLCAEQRGLGGKPLSLKSHVECNNCRLWSCHKTSCCFFFHPFPSSSRSTPTCAHIPQKEQQRQNTQIHKIHSWNFWGTGGAKKKHKKTCVLKKVFGKNTFVAITGKIWSTMIAQLPSSINQNAGENQTKWETTKKNTSASLPGSGPLAPPTRQHTRAPS